MSVLKANCPSCAGAIEFKGGSSIVVVCPFCRSAVARTDRGLADLGKVAEIAESQSPLRLGLKGEFNGQRFELTGRAQLGHELGGKWDEWYATFSNGWVGWLAEAQGRFYLTFYQPLKEGTSLPAFENLQVGQQVPEIPAKSPFVVNEKGTATALAADGEIPYRLEPNEKSRYADISGQDNAFGTIDYGMNPPWVFVGKQVTLDEIGLGHAKPVEREAKSVGATSMKCPHCAGPLELSAPDKTERIACPFCDSLLDVNDGNLSFLKSLDTTNKPTFALEIGSEGTFKGGVKFRIIGAVVRSVTIDGVKYFWHEYLLYNPMIGFRWLVQSDNHWNFVEPVNPADVTTSGSGTFLYANYNGYKFQGFQVATAVVEYVRGEFYWRVEQGERVEATDYICPPLMLSSEKSENEINWSVGTYMTLAEIEKAFGVGGLPKPVTVGPNQPFTGSFYIKWGFALAVLLVIVAIAELPFTGSEYTVLSESIVFPAAVAANTPQTYFSQPFEIKANRNVQITATVPLSNSWAEVDVDLVNEQNQEVESVNIPIEYYSGSDSDGAWSEGSQKQDAPISSLPGGKYTLRLEATREQFAQPMTVGVVVKQNVVRGVNFVCALFLLLVMPLVGIARKISFSSRRWSQSSLGGSSGGDDDSSYDYGDD